MALSLHEQKSKRTPVNFGQWLTVKHLIIDEISMVDAKYFDRLEVIARRLRNNDQPFGGIQLILCGDFFQLPPVTKNKEESSLCFEALSWNSCLDWTHEIKQVQRQTGERVLLQLDAQKLFFFER